MENASITSYGLETVRKHHERAVENLTAVKQNLIDAEKALVEAERCLECSHPEDKLKGVGCFLLCETQCTLCGFTWMD